MQIIKMKPLFRVLSSPRKSSSEPESDILIFQTIFFFFFNIWIAVTKQGRTAGLAVL